MSFCLCVAALHLWQQTRDDMYQPRPGTTLAAYSLYPGAIGVSMQVKRKGKYKTGDLLLRKDMGPEQREVYTSLLEGIRDHFVSTVSKVKSLRVLPVSSACHKHGIRGKGCL